VSVPSLTPSKTCSSARTTATREMPGKSVLRPATLSNSGEVRMDLLVPSHGREAMVAQWKTLGYGHNPIGKRTILSQASALHACVWQKKVQRLYGSGGCALAC
jgi:hypothetical protein